MTKQTFTSGQVLSAAQMTTLQQTAMLGGAASAKVASYVLVAADAGDAITMTSASPTTITVNTGLFAAGDIVTIINTGTGACTITAGTATVTTSGSLVLGQNQGGVLRFTSASAAIFLQFAAPAVSAGANWSLLNAGGTSLTGATTITVSGVSAADKIFVLVSGASSANASATFSIQFNGDSGANYNIYGTYFIVSTTYQTGNIEGLADTGATRINFAKMSDNAGSTVNGGLLLTGGNASGVKMFQGSAGGTASGSVNHQLRTHNGFYNSSSTISSVSILSNSGNFDAGTIFVYTSA